MAEGEGMNAPLIVGQAQAQAQPPPYAYPVQQQPAQNYGSAPQQVVYQQPSQQTPQAIVVQPQVAQPQMVQPQVVQPQIMVVPQQIDYTRITGRHSQQALCPRCQQVVQTKLEYVSGLGTWAVAGGVCLFGCWFGCCLIPFCIDDLKDVEHRCPQCDTFIGVKKMIS